ncbi:MAG: mandelate racemase, partial [Acidimicrobiales bacterium]
MGQVNTTRDFPVIESIDVAVYQIPTDAPEADGTLAWSSTTMVVVQVHAGGEMGLGWTYAGSGSATVVAETLIDRCVGMSAFDVTGANERMARACRNLGRPGVVSSAISAVDIALWDLKARLLSLPLASLFGQVRAQAPIYGSGGFTTYDEPQARGQLEKWVDEWHIPRVKMKIGESWGTNVQRDCSRVAFARKVIGDTTELYVDA